MTRKFNLEAKHRTTFEVFFEINFMIHVQDDQVVSTTEVSCFICKYPFKIQISRDFLRSCHLRFLGYRDFIF
jgi:hypothetical protein